MYRQTKPVKRCQCFQQRVSLPDAECAADLLGNDDAAEVIHPADNACSFHIFPLLVIANYDAIICKTKRIILADLLFRFTVV